MRSVAEELGVKFITISNSSELQNYINSKNINSWELSGDRVNDKITKFTVFSHGLVGTVELGYNQYNQKDLSLDANWIGGLFSEAFDNPNSAFYSCNTGTDQGGIWGYNFAQAWVNKTGGRTWAARGTTSYYNIMNDVFSNKWSRGNLFSRNGADNYPVASADVDWMNFYRY